MNGGRPFLARLSRKEKSWAVASVVLGGILTCSACTTAWVDDQGRCHILGFSHIVLAAPDPDTPIAGTTVAITTFGVASLDVGEGRQWMLGYGHYAFAHLKDDALVLGSPLLGEHGLPRPFERRSNNRPHDGEKVHELAPSASARCLARSS